MQGLAFCKKTIAINGADFGRFLAYFIICFLSMLMAYIGVVSYCAAAISKSSLALYAFPILLLAIVFFFMLARYVSISIAS